MKAPPADNRAAKIDECFMDVIAFVKTCAKASKLVQQRVRLFDNVAKDSQAAAVRLSSPSNRGGNPAAREGHASIVIVVCPVSHHLERFAQRRARFATDRRNRVYQWDQLRDVMRVGAR